MEFLKIVKCPYCEVENDVIINPLKEPYTVTRCEGKNEEGCDELFFLKITVHINCEPGKIEMGEKNVET